MRKLKIEEAISDEPTIDGALEWITSIIKNGKHDLQYPSWSMVERAEDALIEAIRWGLEDGNYEKDMFEDPMDRDLEKFQQTGDYSDLLSMELSKKNIDEGIDNFAYTDKNSLSNWFNKEDKGRNDSYVTRAIEDHDVTDVWDAVEFGNRIAISDIMEQIVRNSFEYATLSSNNFLE